MFHRPSNIDFWNFFTLKKTIFQNGSRWKWENTNPKMLYHRHKRGPREVSSTTTRYVLSGRGLGTHRKPFIPPSECLFFVCGLLFYLVTNGRKWSQMVTNGLKRYWIISFALFTGDVFSLTPHLLHTYSTQDLEYQNRYQPISFPFPTTQTGLQSNYL